MKRLLDIFSRERRICRHLHLPLQHGCNRILQAMNRPYETGYYAELVARIRDACPEAAIGTDIMVGFPGEDQAAFDMSREFLQQLELTYMHVFPYSKRSGTPAADMPGQVDERLKKERTVLLRQLSEDNRRAFMQSRLGQVEQVLVIRRTKDGFQGLTSNYLKVMVDGRPADAIADVRLVSLDEKGLRGTLV